MGTSTNAVLVYGYDLGGGEAPWKLQDVDKWDEPNPSWYVADDSDDEDDDEGSDEEEKPGGFIEQAERRLLAHAGLTGTWRDDGYYAREREAQARVGVEFESYCSGDYPIYTLAAKVITVRRGDCEVLDFEALNAEAAASDWDEKLAAALKVLEITPTQERPRWLLCSYWSG